MLVLSRRINTEVLIGDNVTVRVIDIKGDVVRLGFTAPRDIAIFRREVANDIARNGRRMPVLIPLVPPMPMPSVSDQVSP
jgi:carbon storage regulator